MSVSVPARSRAAVALLLLLLYAGGGAAAQAAPGYLVAAPDRGFSGNEAVRDAFAAFTAANPAAELVFVTTDGTADRLDKALAAMRDEDAEPVVLLPFYLTAAHPDMSVIDRWAADNDVRSGRPFGRSAPALAALRERLRAVDEPAESHAMPGESHSMPGDSRLILLGHGARTDANASAMERELGRLLQAAARGLPFGALEARVWSGIDDFGEEEFREHLAGLRGEGNPGRALVLPFHLGPDLDAMMGFTPRLQAAAPDEVTVLDAGAALQPAMSSWLSREAPRWRTLAPERVGVLVHAHGASWQWNETMRQGAAPLAEDHLVEFAFSMGDPETLEHAVRHLEERGASAIVLVRVFGMASSFRDGILRFIGEAWESCAPAPSNGQGGHHGGHGSTSAPPPLLRTRLPVVTVGGLEDHPLFARALYERALALSEVPARETVILVAHGVGHEAGNAHWREVLESIRSQMLDLGGDRFRAIEVALWSEDWPELRQTAVEHVRSLVQRANDDGGRALVVPARTLGQGPAAEYLEGLDFALGEGFSPHPLFAEWLRLQVQAGVERLRYAPDERWTCNDGK